MKDMGNNECDVFSSDSNNNKPAIAAVEGDSAPCLWRYRSIDCILRTMFPQ